MGWELNMAQNANANFMNLYINLQMQKELSCYLLQFDPLSSSLSNQVLACGSYNLTIPSDLLVCFQFMFVYSLSENTIKFNIFERDMDIWFVHAWLINLHLGVGRVARLT